MIPPEIWRKKSGPLERAGHLGPLAPLGPLDPLDPLDPLGPLERVDPAGPLERVERVALLGRYFPARQLFFPLQSLRRHLPSHLPPVPAKH